MNADQAPAAWPRLMRRETAAAYCDMSPEQFDRQCPVPPKDQGWRGYRWDRAMLDAWIEALPDLQRENKPATESGALDQEHAAGGLIQCDDAEARRRAALARVAKGVGNGGKRRATVD